MGKLEYDFEDTAPDTETEFDLEESGLSVVVETSEENKSLIRDFIDSCVESEERNFPNLLGEAAELSIIVPLDMVRIFNVRVQTVDAWLKGQEIPKSQMRVGIVNWMREQAEGKLGG